MTTSRAWTPPSATEVEGKIEEMVRRIVEGFHPEKIILFGSRARGDAGPESDVDLLVILSTESKKDTLIRMRVAVRAMGIPKDIVVVTPEEFERKKEMLGSIVYPAAREGVVLYERAPKS